MRLAGIAVTIAAILGSFFTPQQPVPEPVPAHVGPVFAADFPDPTVLRVGATYYGYGTATAWQQPGRLFPILESKDLVHWSYVADAFSAPPAWSIGSWWAPSVLHRGGAFYLYYGATARSGIHCLAVALAFSPTGPFADQGTIGCGDGSASGYIDPAPFLDGKNAYLYYSVDGPRHSISVQRLRPDLLGFEGPRSELFGVTQPWESGSDSTVEAPWVIKRGSLFFLTYSGNDWRADYAVGVATSKSPLGPFVKSLANPILQTQAGLAGPGGGSVVDDPRGGLWFAYHAWTAGGRSLRVDRVRIRGAALTVVPTGT